jgi:hypothetical protein
MNKGKREHFMGVVGPQIVAKEAPEIEDVFKLFFDGEVVDKVAEESSFYEVINYQACQLVVPGNP